MRWNGLPGSRNVIDRRNVGGPLFVGGGVLGVIVLLFNLFMGGDVSELQRQLPMGNAPLTAEQQAREDSLARFVSVVLAETEDVWNEVFQKHGQNYSEPQLILFRGYTSSSCGNASAASGPFYCPTDHSLYIDLSFYDELKNRFGAPGDFAMAYVVAHEVGHHIQRLNGTIDQLHRLRQKLPEDEYNRYSVALELQADFLAGVWAHHEKKMKNTLEHGDVEEALTAASAIGDDRLQLQQQGYVVPDAFTHGTSQQRMYWFKRGFETGDLSQGNTFKELGLQN